MNEKQRKDALKRGISLEWPPEPILGSYYGEEEVEAIVKTVRASMDPRVGFGFICEEIWEFERAFAQWVGTEFCVSINGAGGGLDMAMMCLDLEPGDEVIVPSINFRASPLAVLGQRATPIFAEIDPKTLNLDPNDVERKVTPRTRAIVPTHMNGLSADMDALEEIGRRHPHPKYGPIPVIGDAARTLGATYKGTKVGKKGWMNIFSFHTQKMITTLGEGGAITTDDRDLATRLQGIRQFGNPAHSYDPKLRGIGWGSNYKMTKIQAAVGLVQIKRLDDLVARRQRLARARTAMLEGCPGLQLPYEPEGYESSFYLYTILVPKEWAGEKRDQLMTILKEQYKVECVVANPPVHNTVPYIAEHAPGQNLPISDEVGARIFCPPIHPYMPDEDNEYIAAAIWEAVLKLRD
ncbi:MAG TPA: DegT/DnrJ/EryC1/StrS family aminotransferase [Armatimonadota bacterium]|nr:DegT/DnrJ/EryC1/StrS family aminotransferase [Armatimonadota bacterium]HOJ20673.1 DegT/DnrJ/EryC1/StrS family aminotransferase [Armatimonadota bacterium]HOM81347.1 DegT/DnrJ/EryC1/StrS family aminotransferase [Armatimonadota bacterium]HPO74651.1 DegT/DnrJ/EryC1/StrS family aminotransferase [Armatimonadota bacterium]HPT96563.1 DegT/DnrJ/EryC1/StrS family aminotransferase [Armatimonadota bacterium]